MFILTIVFGNNDTSWQMCFNTKTRAEEAMADVFTGDVSDDFGTKITLKEAPVAMMLRDIEAAQPAEIESALHQARTQHKAQRLASTDPLLSSQLVGLGGQSNGRMFQG
jgi:hypothetical protein